MKKDNKKKVEEYPTKLKEFWKTVYKKEENKISEIWNIS